MAKLTFLCISFTYVDYNTSKEEDTNGGHVNLPEMTVQKIILNVRIC